MNLASLADIRSGSLHDRSGSDALYVLVGDIAAGSLRMSQLAPGVRPAKANASTALAQGDVVVALRGTNNPAATVPALDDVDKLVFATLDVAVIRATEQLLPDYLAWFLNLPETQSEFATDRSGSAAPRLPISALKALNVPLPPIERQTAIAAIAAEAAHEQSLIHEIRQLRQRLLNELLRQAAEEGPVLGASSARANQHPHRRGATSRAFSNPEDWSA